MNDFFIENKRALFILTAGLFLLAVVLFFLLVKPLFADLTKLEQSIEKKEAEKNALEKKLAETDTETDFSDVESWLYEKKIPVERELDEYILAIQQLELVANSKIIEVIFAYDSNINAAEEVKEKKSRTETEVESVNKEEEADEEVTINPEILKEKPERLQVMTIRVKAASPSYEDFLTFIEAVEAMERISIVTKLEFTQADEKIEYFTENPIEIIPFEAEITTFYYLD